MSSWPDVVYQVASFFNRRMGTAALSRLIVWFRTCRGGLRRALGAVNRALLMALATNAMLVRPHRLDSSMSITFSHYCRSFL